jgi:hypothetical protein
MMEIGLAEGRLQLRRYPGQRRKPNCPPGNASQKHAHIRLDAR